jgi:hypothetical protein
MTNLGHDSKLMPKNSLKPQLSKREFRGRHGGEGCSPLPGVILAGGEESVSSSLRMTTPLILSMRVPMARLHPPSSKTCEHLTPHSPALPLFQLFFRLVLVERFGTLSSYAFPHREQSPACFILNTTPSPLAQDET